MSPASQGNLEVERYIGSYLISSSVRVNNNSGKINNSNSNPNYKIKKVAESGGPRPGVLNHRANCGASISAGNTNSVGNCQDHHYSHISGGFPSPGNLLPLCECGGLKFGNARYGSPGPNAGVGGSWAGLPLFSMAPSNSRRNRKPSTSSSGSSNNGNRNLKNQTSAAVNSANCKIAVDLENSSPQSRSPLSRLAIHTQGAPLILAGRYNINGRKNNVNQNRGPPPRQFRGGDLPVRRSNSVKETRDISNNGGNANGSNGSTPNSDCLSVASDESSGHSENSLPRIIKPRKRRKKDRKPLPQSNSTPPDTTNPLASNELKNTPLESPSIVTLKPYVPVCYELYDSGRWNGSRRSVNKNDVEGRVKNWEIENSHSFRTPYVLELPRDDEEISQTSEDDNPEPKLHHNFDDVEEDEEGVRLENGTLYPYPCPPSLCQCRYCDPSGLIWDVEQHCYSPFLTPPSPTIETKTYPKSPFASIPLFLTPPSNEVRNFDFLNKDGRSSPSPSLYLSDNNHPSSLRRSWSEPLPSTLHSGIIANREEDSLGNFGVIGRGRSSGDDNAEPSREQHNTNNILLPNVTLLTSQSLEVSTEIVTSPNGHRDIEIKFYSSSPPAGTALISSAEVKDNEEINEEGFAGGVTISVQKEDVNPLISIHENKNWGRSGGDACAIDGNVRVNAKCHSGDGEVQCEIPENKFREQSAKHLGEEVNQLRLHAEE